MTVRAVLDRVLVGGTAVRYVVLGVLELLRRARAPRWSGPAGGPGSASAFSRAICFSMTAGTLAIASR